MASPSIICPVDFSESSRSALRYAATIAEHFYAGLTVLTVDDALLSGGAGRASGATRDASRTREYLARFVKDTFRRRTPTIAELRLETATGKPALEILKLAVERDADLIVVSTQGRTGLAKAFFGSTTERLLRTTCVPVLVTPTGDPGPADLEDLTRGFGSVLAPLDLTTFGRRQLAIAQGLARALGTTLTVLHVIEPRAVPSQWEMAERLSSAERKRLASAELAMLTVTLGLEPEPEIVIAEGDAAAEIVRLAADKGAGVIVIGLHNGTTSGARMGSVTYRVLCQTNRAVLALPPAADGIDRKPEVFARASHCLDHAVRR
jgi:nucleotide-binding universal stress UspA family protein